MPWCHSGQLQRGPQGCLWKTRGSPEPPWVCSVCSAYVLDICILPDVALLCVVQCCQGIGHCFSDKICWSNWGKTQHDAWKPFLFGRFQYFYWESNVQVTFYHVAKVIQGYSVCEQCFVVTRAHYIGYLKIGWSSLWLQVLLTRWTMSQLDNDRNIL